jgi:hypothetical protein
MVSSHHDHLVPKIYSSNFVCGIYEKLVLLLSPEPLFTS